MDTKMLYSETEGYDQEKSGTDIDYDKNNKSYKINSEGSKRICENCNQECLGTSYCEHCVRNYLKANFSNWTSGNDEIDNLIQKCQMETLAPNVIIEWIPYNSLHNIKYLTKGGSSEIYTAVWVNGEYEEWDFEKKELQRYGVREVILKKTKIFNKVKQNCFEEAKSLLSISIKRRRNIVKFYGITQDPVSENYMLVMKQMDIDLRKYLQQYHNQLTWKERIKITFDIIEALNSIHKENAIHRDLHSGNILYSKYNKNWFISDFGFSGPADRPSESIYGNLPYIAPEVIFEKEYSKASDVYSMGMVMWEISSGQPPFSNYEHDLDVTMKIINGIRPKIVSETPVEYKNLMMQCWDANPLNRPDGNTLRIRIEKLKALHDEFPSDVLRNSNNLQSQTNYLNNNEIKNTSKIYIFKNLPKPKNASEMEQEQEEDCEDNIYNNPNLHSEDQDELEIPEIDDLNELYNKGISDDLNMESEAVRLDSNIENESGANVNEANEKGLNEKELNENEANDNETNERELNVNEANERELNVNEVNEDESNERELNENELKGSEDEKSKSKNKKKFVGTFKGSINKISKFVKNKKDKKFDKDGKDDINKMQQTGIQ